MINTRIGYPLSGKFMPGTAPVYSQYPRQATEKTG